MRKGTGRATSNGGLMKVRARLDGGRLEIYIKKKGQNGRLFHHRPSAVCRDSIRPSLLVVVVIEDSQIRRRRRRRDFRDVWRSVVTEGTTWVMINRRHQSHVVSAHALATPQTLKLERVKPQKLGSSHFRLYPPHLFHGYPFISFFHFKNHLSGEREIKIEISNYFPKQNNKQIKIIQWKLK